MRIRQSGGSQILRGLRPKYEEHHRLVISEEAIDQAAKLSDRYISDRYLPDKAIDLIDEASSRVRLRASSLPPEGKEVERELRKVRPLLSDRPAQLRRLDILETVSQQKMDELESTIVERRASRPDAALVIVRTDRGKIYMDRIRSLIADMETAERELIALRLNCR